MVVFRSEDAAFWHLFCVTKATVDLKDDGAAVYLATIASGYFVSPIAL